MSELDILKAKGLSTIPKEVRPSPENARVAMRRYANTVRNFSRIITKIKCSNNSAAGSNAKVSMSEARKLAREILSLASQLGRYPNNFVRIDGRAAYFRDFAQAAQDAYSERLRFLEDLGGKVGKTPSVNLRVGSFATFPATVGKHHELLRSSLDYIRSNLTKADANSQLLDLANQARDVLDSCARRIEHLGSSVSSAASRPSVSEPDCESLYSAEGLLRENSELSADLTYLQQILLRIKGPSSRMTSGTLKSHGHVLQRHCGLSALQLMNRLMEKETLPAVSTFFDREVAEQAIAEALAGNKTKIAAWLLNTDDRKPYVGLYTLSRFVGYGFVRGSNRVLATKLVQVVLVKTTEEPHRVQANDFVSGWPSGCLLTTAFPCVLSADILNL